MTVRILADSTCDLPAEIVAALNITVMPMYIHIGNRDYLDRIDITREEFFENLPIYPEQPSTAVPSPAKFHSLYTALADQGASEILSIHISSTLSAVVNVARTAAEEIRSAKVTVLDSRQLSLGTGFLVQKAAELAKLGFSVREILPVLEDQLKRTYVSAMLSTLKYLRRSGRMSAAISSIGELIQIKPILSMHEGVSQVERVRTRQKALSRLAEILKSFSSFENIAFLHSGAIETVHTLQQEVHRLLPKCDIWMEMINPVLGAHIGPGVVGFACVEGK